MMELFKIILISHLTILIYCQSENKNLKGYRLGDMIRSHQFRTYSTGRKLHYRDFPNSIATEYMKLTNNTSDLDILNEIVDRRAYTLKVYPNDSLIVHLRLGDVIDNSPYSIDEFLSQTVLWEGRYNYVKPLNYYQRILEKIDHFDLITKVILMGGFHHPNKNYPYNTTKSREYISKIAMFFQKAGYSIKFRIDGDADEDFIYACCTHFFTPSGGGFSKLISNIVLKRGGIVFY